MESSDSNFATDSVLIAEELTDKVKNYISNIIKREGYTSHKIDVKKVDTGGNNFLGELYEINIKGVINDQEKEIFIFIKHIIHNDDFRVYSIPEVYAKEAFVYNELKKYFNELQDKYKVPMGEKFKFVYSFEETDPEVIILENMTRKGFMTMPRLDIMSIEFARLSVKELAKFHAMSFVLEKEYPEFFETKIKSIKQSMVYDDYWNDFVKNMCQVSAAKFDTKTKDKIDDFFKTSLEKYPKYMNGLHSKIKCLCHGDYKMNNILMRKNEGSVVEVITIDYQQIYYGCPVIDLIYFIYAASDRSFRKQHLNHLKDLYFETLTSFLNHFYVDVASVYPREEFDQCFHGSLDYALMYTLYMLPMFFVEDNIPDLSKDELLDINIKVNDIFYDRMQGIVDDFTDLGVI